MNCKGIHGFVTAILIAVLLLSTPYDTSAGYEEGPDHVISSMAQNPIWIEGDTSFDEYAAYYGWNGNGSRGNPYIIKDHVIDSRGSDRGIGISGTDHYFRIENCTVHDVYGGSGIYISLAKGDIISCSLWNNTIGIHLTDCSDIKVHGNNLSNNDRGAHVHRSSNVSLEQNLVHSGKIGIYSENSNNITISGNTINCTDSYAVKFDQMIDSRIENNHATRNQCSIHLYHSLRNTIANNTNINNDDEAVILSRSSCNSVEWNHADRNDIGVQLELGSNNNHVHNNTIFECNDYGIYIDDSRGNRFEHNRFRFSNFYIEPDIEILQKQSISTTNKVSGRPIYHYNGSDHDGTEVPIDAGQVIAGGVSNLSIKGLHIPKGTVGIEALECYDLMINDTFIDTQHYYGVLGRDCNSIIIYESHIYSELNGVDLCNCRDVEIKNCALRSGSLNIRIESGDDINILSSSFEDSDEGIWISGVGSAAVRDCELSNISNIGIRSNSNKAVISSCSFENMINGIELEAVAYNIIEKCQFTDSRKGVHLTQGSKMNRIEQSSFNSCNTSIGLRGSEENIIENNSMAGTKKDNTIEGAFGISAYYSGSNQIISNDIFDLDNGLYLFASERTMIINNSFVDSDIRILGIGVHHYTGHTITLDNTINNRKIYYLDSINASDLSFEDEPGQIIAVNVHDLNIRGVGHSGNGGQDEHDNWTCHIALAYSHDIRIEQCTFENGMIGIEIITSRSITISENLFKNLDRGIWGRDSSNLVLSDNRFGSGIIEGIYLFLCSGSMVTDSTFHGLETGLRIFGSWNNSVIGSFFTENGKDILIGQNSMENTVRGNMFLGTENASITLEIDTDRNVIIDNAFLSLEDPKIGPDNETLFMECSGFSNRIEKNYWSTGPGSAELDQEYLDQPMNISGYAGSRDPYPLTNIPRSILSAPWKLSVEMLNLTHLRITWNASKLIGITEDIEYVLTVINESSKEVLERIIVNDQNETLYVEIEYDRSDIVVHVQAQILNHTSYPNSTIFPIPNEGPRIFTDLDIDGRTINWTEIDVTWTVSSNFTDEFMHFYSIDGEHWIEIEDPHFILSGVHEGDFTFRISSMDLLGNMNEKRFEFYWDNTAPTFNITSPVEGSLLPGEFSVNWTFDQEDPDIDHMEWTLDGDRWIEEYDQAEGKTFALSTGEHHLTLTAYDIALNRFSRSMDLLIDADPPEFVIEKIPRSTDPLIFEILIMFSEDVSIDDTVIYMVGDPGRITWDNARTAHYLPSLEMEYEMMYHIFVSTIDLAGNKMEGEDSFYFILPPEGYGVLHAVIKGKGLNENIRGIMYLDGSIHNDTIYPGNIHIDDLLPGTYIITFEFNGYEQYIIDVEIVAGHETDLGTIELVPIGDPEVKDHSTFIMIGVVSMAVIAILCLLIIKKGRDGTYEE